MGTQSRTSFKKRQKELARQEKQRDKTARRLERKNLPKMSPEDAIAAPEEFLTAEEIGSDVTPALPVQE
jgi:hypothetical protein